MLSVKTRQQYGDVFLPLWIDFEINFYLFHFVQDFEANELRNNNQ